MEPVSAIVITYFNCVSVIILSFPAGSDGQDLPAHFVNHRDTSSDASAIFYGQNISKRKLRILPL